MSVEYSSQRTFRIWQPVFVLGSLLVAALLIAACSGGTVNTATTSGMGTVTVMVSDPATCQAPDGPFSHVYVTITDIKANVSSTAGGTDGSWVDLTPNLSKSPKQVDLLGLANPQCFLASLGDPLELQAGTYQQIRVILAANNATVSGNHCGSSANCVILASDSSTHPLLLSSESQTGIKIPGSQITSGGFSIGAGQTKELDIDFLTCESIVREGNGQYRLKPVLHAGEVSAISTSINGTVVDAATGKAVNGTVYVAVEQPDATAAKVDRVFMYEKVNADGTFVFCPLPNGTYDVVVMGTTTGGSFYQPTIVTGVSVGSTTGNIKLYLPAATPNASLAGTVTAQTASNAGATADVQLSALETVGGATYTIPLPPTQSQSSATLGIETAAAVSPATCPPGPSNSATYCAPYALNVPSGAANIGAWTSGGVTLTVTANLATYSVDGIATVPNSGGTLDCGPSELTVAAPALTTTALSPTSINLAFTSCQ
jgi:hypothetical protein